MNSMIDGAADIQITSLLMEQLTSANAQDYSEIHALADTARDTSECRTLGFRGT